MILNNAHNIKEIIIYGLAPHCRSSDLELRVLEAYSEVTSPSLSLSGVPIPDLEDRPSDRRKVRVELQMKAT